MKHYFICSCVALLAISMPSYAFIVNHFSNSAFNSNVATMNANLGLDSSYQFEDFEDDSFAAGLTISYLSPLAGTPHQFISVPDQIWEGSQAIFFCWWSFKQQQWWNSIQFC